MGIYSSLFPGNECGGDRHRQNSRQQNEMPVTKSFEEVDVYLQGHIPPSRSKDVLGGGGGGCLMGKPHWVSKHCSSASLQPTEAHDRNSNTSACQLIEAPVLSPGGQQAGLQRTSLSCCMLDINYYSSITSSTTSTFTVGVCFRVSPPVSCLGRRH